MVRAVLLAALVLLALQGCASSSPGTCPEAPSGRSLPTVDAQSSADSTVDTSGWATGKQSAFASGPRFPARPDPWSRQCLSDLGCAAPANVPPCPARVEALPIDALMANPERRVGKPVLVRGRLVAAASITQMRCGAGCCNNGDGGMLLNRTERAGGLVTASLARLPLVDRAHPDAFHCARDDSMACCGFETPEHDVVVSARLVPHPGGLALEDPALCVMRPENDHMPEVAFDADGCTANGVHHAWGEHFKAGDLPGDLRCACYGRRLYCRADLACFRGGQWFAPGEERPISGHCGGVCVCRNDWECEVRPCAMTHVEFAPGAATLDPAHAKRLGEVAFATIRGPIRVEIRGHADPSEAKDAVALARRRADYMARIVEKNGIPRQQMEVRALGAFRPGPSQATSLANVVLVFWQPELPSLPPPKPP